jgi:hypothetical protein
VGLFGAEVRNEDRVVEDLLQEVGSKVVNGIVTAMIKVLVPAAKRRPDPGAVGQDKHTELGRLSPHRESAWSGALPQQGVDGLE